MFVLFDGFLELHRPEAGRSCEDYDISQSDRLLVAIEPNELMFLRHVNAVCMFLFEIAQAAFEMIFEDIGHSDELDRARGAEGLVGRAGATTTTPNQGDLKRVAACRMGAALD